MARIVCHTVRLYYLKIQDVGTSTPSTKLLSIVPFTGGDAGREGFKARNQSRERSVAVSDEALKGTCPPEDGSALGGKAAGPAVNGTLNNLLDSVLVVLQLV